MVSADRVARFGQRDMDRLALSLPEELRGLTYWLCWVAGPPDPKKNGRFPKVPWYAAGGRRSGEQGSAEDRAKLVDFREAATAAIRQKRSGVGLAILPGCGIVAGDFDEVLTRGVREVPADLAAKIGETYVELSPSGTGIRCFWTSGREDIHSWKTAGTEIFGDSGFVTVTGQVLTPCAELSAAPDWTRSRPSPAAAPATIRRPDAGQIPDDCRGQLIEDLRSALGFLPADDYSMWVKCAHALHKLGAEGRELWDVWSQKSEKYDPGAAAYVWRSIEDSRIRTTHKAIFSAAKAAGWENPAKGRRSRKRRGGRLGPADQSLPVVRIEPGELPRACDEIERLAVERGAEIYQRGGVLVAVTRQSAATAAAFQHSAGTLRVCVLTAHAARDRIQRHLRFEKFDERSAEFVDCDLPDLHARTLLDRGAWRFPALSGVVAAPSLRPDGSILAAEGYDADTGLLVDFGGAKFLPVPDCPSHPAAVEALHLLREQFGTFPFVTGCDQDTYVSAIVTGLLRQNLRVAPAFGITSPTKGTGKTLLAQLGGVITSGQSPAMGTLPPDETEASKQVLSLLIEGDQIVVLDNIDATLKSPCLEAVLTAETISGRLLGASRTVKVPTAALWLMTGNNLAPGSDMARRILPIRLDAEAERPWERRFDGDIRSDVLARRAELVRAALTVARAYFVAGRPKVDGVSLGGFTEWSRTVRDAIVWAGGHDVAGGLRQWDAGDPETNNTAALFRVWHAAVGPNPITVKRLFDRAKMPDNEPLLSALEDCAASRGGCINGRTLGRFLRRHEKQVVGGYRLVSTGEIDSGKLWSVAPVGGMA